MCVTFVTCEVRGVCGLRCRSGSSLYIYRVYLLLTYLRQVLVNKVNSKVSKLTPGVAATTAYRPVGRRVFYCERCSADGSSPWS